MPVAVSLRLRLALAVALLVSLASGFGGSARAATVDPNVISHSGSSLMLHGHAYRFTGVNAYELGTYWNVNAGCGGQLTTAQLDAFFGGLRPSSVVRFWAFQAQGVNRTTHKVDFTGLDRVFRAAERHGQRLLPVLGNQDGTCDDGHWKNRAWYAGGYAQKYNDDHRGLNVVPFTSWVTAVVNRYKTSSALGMWEPVNEPESADCAAGFLGPKCYGHQVCPATAPAALRSFFDVVGAQIKRLDPKHLIVSGLIGGGQCGAQSTQYSTVHASRYVDVATVHDYGQDHVPVPGDQWNGMAVRISQARALGKPLITEEIGIEAGPATGTGCVSGAGRTALLTSKLRGQLAAGARGFLLWNYGPTANAGCTYDVLPTDPMMTVLRTQPL
ncbi:MAG: beta-mannosidase [Frankiales bacterium]|nr:beta-mannosidase [Frankiales bacterium]